MDMPDQAPPDRDSRDSPSIQDAAVPRISAVICTYHNPRGLETAIQSLQSQSLPGQEYEVIVVDNNSGDETREVVLRHAPDPRCRVEYILETARGLSNARNAGVRAAKADIVAFLDDDAVADPDWLASLLEVYDRTDEAWAVGGKVLPLWEAERPAWLPDPMLRALSIVEWGEEPRPLRWPERIIGANLSMRKRVFSEIGLFDTALGRKGTLLLGSEDTEIQERIHTEGKLVFYTPGAVVRHRVPSARLNKAYFCRRSYGMGRTDAILMRRRSTVRQLLNQAAGIWLALPHQWLSALFTRKTEQDLFNFRQGQYYQAGFIYQCLRFLLGQDRDAGIA